MLVAAGDVDGQTENNYTSDYQQNFDSNHFFYAPCSDGDNKNAYAVPTDWRRRKHGFFSVLWLECLSLVVRTRSLKSNGQRVPAARNEHGRR